MALMTDFWAHITILPCGDQEILQGDMIAAGTTECRDTILLVQSARILFTELSQVKLPPSVNFSSIATVLTYATEEYNLLYIHAETEARIEGS